MLTDSVPSAWCLLGNAGFIAAEAVEAALGMLDSGEGRVAEPDGKGGWTVNQWLKKAVLLSFRLNDNRVMDGGSAGHPVHPGTPKLGMLGNEKRVSPGGTAK